MKEIDVIKGVRYTPDMFLKRMNKSKRLKHIDVSYANTIYSPCWLFQFRVALKASKKTTRYAGYYGGFEESTMSPGKLAFLPGSEKEEVKDEQILMNKLTEEEALQKTWEYNIINIIKKFRSLYAPPVLEDYKAEMVYKPMYIMRFHNTELDEVKYKVLDSLSGDLEDIIVN